jgi:hypothetical protein
VGTHDGRVRQLALLRVGEQRGVWCRIAEHEGDLGRELVLSELDLAELAVAQLRAKHVVGRHGPGLQQRPRRVLRRHLGRPLSVGALVASDLVRRDGPSKQPAGKLFDEGLGAGSAGASGRHAAVRRGQGRDDLRANFLALSEKPIRPRLADDVLPRARGELALGNAVERRRGGVDVVRQFVLDRVLVRGRGQAPDPPPRHDGLSGACDVCRHGLCRRILEQRHGVGRRDGCIGRAGGRLVAGRSVQRGPLALDVPVAREHGVASEQTDQPWQVPFHGV